MLSCRHPPIEFSSFCFYRFSDASLTLWSLPPVFLWWLDDLLNDIILTDGNDDYRNNDIVIIVKEKENNKRTQIIWLQENDDYAKCLVGLECLRFS